MVPEENFDEKSEKSKQKGRDRDPERAGKESQFRVEKPISRTHVHKIKLGIQNKLLSRRPHRLNPSISLFQSEAKTEQINRASS